MALKHVKRLIGIQASRRMAALVANVSQIKQEAFPFMGPHTMQSVRCEWEIRGGLYSLMCLC